MTKKISILWIVSKEQYQNLIKQSSSLSEILRKLNLNPKGGNIHTLKKVLNEYGLDYSNIKLGLNSNKERLNLQHRPKIPNEKLFVKNSKFSRAAVKKRILKENLIPYKCKCCGLGPIWNGKELVLVLDHINGINNDHRLENLRFLCPNCNAQQDTFCGKHLKSLPRKLKAEQKEKLKQLYLEDINKKCNRILSYDIDFFKFGWVEKVAKLENTSHTSIRRFMQKYMKDFYYSKCYIRKNQFK